MKDLWICVQSFGKICWPVFDLSISCKIDTTWAKVCMNDPGLKGLNALIVDYILADTDVFEASSGRRKKVTTSYDQTRRRHHVWKKTSDLRRLEDVWFMTSWRRPIYVVLKTSNLWSLENVWFTTSWERLIYDVLKTSDLCRLEDVQFKTPSRRL